MVAVSEFLTYIHKDLHQCTEALVTERLGTILTEFCQATKIWQVDLDPLTIIPNVKDIDLCLPENTTLVEIRRLVFDGKTELVAKSIDWLDRDDINWRTKSGDPTFYTNVSRNVIRVSPHPDTVQALKITGRVAVKPTRTATTVDDFLFDDWAETIAAGTKAALLSMPSKPWTSQNEAALFSMQYQTGVNEALAMAGNNHTARIRRRTKAYF